MPDILSPEGFARVKELFLACVDRPPAEQQEHLDEACAGDEELKQQVWRMLRNQPSSIAAVTDVVDPAACLMPAGPSASIGESIGPYKLMEQLGEGGMGIVYIAEQKTPVRRQVALKVIKPGMDTRQVVARFEAERQALSMMDHQNIARIFDGGTTNEGRPYFVMELVRGVPITDFCDAERLTIRQRLELFIQVCQAVQHAHQKGIIHRDLKPTNILVTRHDETPVPKVIDFGIAKAVNQSLTDKTIYTQFAQFIGTPLYMSPEQAQLSGLDIDTRSDVYSLGVLLYELLTGTTPFDAETLKQKGLDEMRRIIREDEPPQPSQRISTLNARAGSTISERRSVNTGRLRQTVRGELDWIVMRAMEKDRNRRYESASAFAADIGRYLNHEPVEASPPSSWYRVRKYAQRYRGVLATVTLIMVALVTGTAVSLWQAYEAHVSRNSMNNALVLEGRARQLADTRFQEAETERQIAAASYQKAHETVKTLLSQVATGDVERIPGMRDLYVKLIDEAIAAYEDLARLKPNDADIHIEQADLLLLKGEYLRAKDKYFRAVELRPLDSAAHFGYARALEGSWPPQFDEGMIDAANGIINFRKLSAVDSALGEQALRFVARAEELEGTSTVQQRLLRAKIVFRLERAAEAFAIVAKLQSVETLRIHEIVELAEIFNAMGDYQNGLKYADMALAEDSIYYRALFQRGESHRLAGHYEKAIADYTDSQRLDPRVNHFHRLEILERRADAYISFGKYPEGLADCDIVLKADPSRWLALKRRALAHFHLQDYSAALADLQAAIALQPEDKSILMWIPADRVVRCENKEFVAGIFELASVSRIHLAQLQQARAVLHLEQKQYDAALQDIVRVAEADAIGKDGYKTLELLIQLVPAYRRQLWPLKTKYDAGIEDRYTKAKGILVAAYKKYGKFSPVTRDALLAKMAAGTSFAAKLDAELRLDDAIEVALGDYSDSKTIWGDEQSWTLIARNNLAQRLLFAGKYAEVEKWLGPEARLDKLDGDDTRTYFKVRLLGMAYLEQGQFEAADQQFSKSLEIARRVQGENSGFALASIYYRATTSYYKGDFAEAERQLVEDVLPFNATLRDGTFGGSVDDLDVVDRLALTYEAQGKFVELEPLARKYWEDRKVRTPNTTKTSHALSLLGASLVGQQKLDEAELYLLEAYQGLAETNSRAFEVTQDLQRAAKRLASFYEAKDQPQEAEIWNEKAAAARLRWPPPVASPTVAAIKFDLRLIPGLSGQVIMLGDRGDMVVRGLSNGKPVVPVVYRPATESGPEAIVTNEELLTPQDSKQWDITFTYAANRKGVIICEAKDASDVRQICSLDYSRGTGQGTITPIMPSVDAWVYGVNDNGAICGRYKGRAFIKEPSAEWRYLFPTEDAAAGDVSVANRINSWGEIIGQKNGQGFRYTPASVKNMRTSPIRGEPIQDGEAFLVLLDGFIAGKGNKNVNQAKVLNDLGHFAGNAVGSMRIIGGKRANEFYAYHFLDAPHRDVVGMDALLERDSRAFGINERGDIVGAWGGKDSFIYLHEEYQALHLVADTSVFGNPGDLRRWRQGAFVLAINNRRLACGMLLDPDMPIFVLTPQ